ncbi:MAG: M48 family metallopeptidase [Thermodesulfobacteriota bacterium]
MNPHGKKNGHSHPVKYRLAVWLLLFTVVVTGCRKTMGVIADVGAASGAISGQQADSIKKSGAALEKTFEDITPEQEYYIGRTVGAVITGKYTVYNQTKATEYINVLGQTLAQYSDMPETFGGYHFLILDSEEINAFAAPGGLIFVTRGLLRCCKNEDAVAAVLAHEIGHVQHQHGLRAIEKSRMTAAVTTLALESAKSFGGEELASLTTTFEGSIADITGTLINSGYSRAFERQADQAAVSILDRVGYSPAGLIDMLEVMKTRIRPGGPDFAKTHPSPEDRIADIRGIKPAIAQVRDDPARAARFKAALKGV